MQLLRLAIICSCLPHITKTRPITHRHPTFKQRDLIGLLVGGGDGGGRIVPTVEPIATTSTVIPTSSSSLGKTPVRTTSSISILETRTDSNEATSLKDPPPSPPSHIALPSATTTFRGSSIPSETIPSTVTTLAVPYASSATYTPPGEATEWKVIGMAVITITFIATVILAVAFFDSWWGFLRAAVLGHKDKPGEENLVPDWQKRTWEYNLASEDGHRYPTMASSESIAKVPPEMLSKTEEPSPVVLPQFVISSPGATYAAAYDPYSIEELGRGQGVESSGKNIDGVQDL